MLTCHDVANYFLALVDEDAGDTISNMKLQKLVYYAQGFYLALYGKPLFPERIEAWDQGPVIPELYRRFEKFGAKAIEKPEEVDFSKFDSQTRGLLDEIWSVYGQFSAWKLRNMVYGEMPWQRAYGKGSVISEADMKEYFKKLLVKEEVQDDS
jgi:uncharacterized phage-associated protein